MSFSISRFPRRRSSTKARKSSRSGSKSDESTPTTSCSPCTIDLSKLAITTPAPLVAPRTPEEACTTPSKNLLQRYQSRSGSAKGPEITTTELYSPSSHEARTTRFREDITTGYMSDASTVALKDGQSGRSPLHRRRKSSLSPVSPTSRADPFVLYTQQPYTVQGVDFMMQQPYANDAPRQRSQRDEPNRPRLRSHSRSSSGDGLIPRTTRSQSRREERADSYLATLDPSNHDKDGLSATNAAILTEQEQPPRSSSRYADHVDIVSIRRPSAPAPSSPNTTSSSETTIPTRSPSSGSVPRASALQKLEKRGLSIRTRNFSSPNISGTTTATNGPSPKQQLPSPRSSPRSRTPSDTPPRQVLYSALSDSGSDREDDFFISPRATVRVKPPIYNCEQPLETWISNSASSSRPARPFGDTKRWSCCRCHATTIVEQEVCAHIRCGHERCGGGCQCHFGKQYYVE